MAQRYEYSFIFYIFVHKFSERSNGNDKKIVTLQVIYITFTNYQKKIH